MIYTKIRNERKINMSANISVGITKSIKIAEVIR